MGQLVGLHPARKRNYKPEPGPNLKTNLIPKSCPKQTIVNYGLKISAMLPNYFDYSFVHLRQKHVSGPKFLWTLGPNPAQTRPEKPDPTYNSDMLSGFQI